MTQPPLAPLGEHSRPGWFLERRCTCRHLQTAEDAGIAENDLELVPWKWIVLRREFNHASSDLEKCVQPAMETAGLKWFPA